MLDFGKFVLQNHFYIFTFQIVFLFFNQDLDRQFALFKFWKVGKGWWIQCVGTSERTRPTRFLSLHHHVIVSDEELQSFWKLRNPHQC